MAAKPQKLYRQTLCGLHGALDMILIAIALRLAPERVWGFREGPDGRGRRFSGDFRDNTLRTRRFSSVAEGRTSGLGRSSLRKERPAALAAASKRGGLCVGTESSFVEAAIRAF